MRLTPEQVLLEAREYHAAQEVIDFLVQGGMAVETIKLCIEMKKARDMLDIKIFLAEIVERLK